MQRYQDTVESQFNEVPGNWENEFVVSGDSHKRKPRYNEFVGNQPKSSLLGMVNN